VASITATRQTKSSASRSDTQLRRDVRLTDLTFVSLGSIIGSGWLLGAFTAASTAGAASLISWILAGAILALLALVHAELYVVLGIGAVVFVANFALAKTEKRPDPSSWRSSIWLLPWLAGMAVIDKLGQFNGGNATIPFWWDLGVVAVFSLAIFYFAVSLVQPPDRVQSAVDEDLREADDPVAAAA
jgi:hypothetical protein